MRFKVGDIVLLKDDGDTEYEVLISKESGNEIFHKKPFDYVVAKKGIKKKAGEYIRHVFEENMYLTNVT